MAPDDLFPRDLPGSPEAAAPQGPRQTLAMRLAERNRQRALRAERLARLRPLAAVSEGTSRGSARGGAGRGGQARRRGRGGARGLPARDRRRPPGAARGAAGRARHASLLPAARGAVRLRRGSCRGAGRPRPAARGRSGAGLGARARRPPPARRPRAAGARRTRRPPRAPRPPRPGRTLDRRRPRGDGGLRSTVAGGPPRTGNPACRPVIGPVAPAFPTPARVACRGSDASHVVLVVRDRLLDVLEEGRLAALEDEAASRSRSG